MDRPLEELLYDLDLTPGQSRSKANILRKMAVEDMYKKIEQLKKKNEWLIDNWQKFWFRKGGYPHMTKEKIKDKILKTMQQALNQEGTSERE